PKGVDAANLPLRISAEDSTPAYLQLAKQLEALISSRTLRAGTQLPTSRALADSLGVNRNTVVAAFERLNSLGLIETRGRRGTLVSNLSRATRRPRGKSQPIAKGKVGAASQIDFRLGSADPTPLPIEVWRRACREAGRYLPGADYGDPQGDFDLRAQIAL